VSAIEPIDTGVKSLLAMTALSKGQARFYHERTKAVSQKTPPGETMGKNVELTASDGHKYQAYVAEPSATPRRTRRRDEIFGVTPIMRVTDDFAATAICASNPFLRPRRRGSTWLHAARHRVGARPQQR
jgi:hypothetical protein